jgi:hypothetical protein
VYWSTTTWRFNSVGLFHEQDLIGISAEAYRINLYGCNRTLQYAVSSCFEDIPPHQITNIVVTAVAQHSGRVMLFHGNDGGQGTISDGSGTAVRDSTTLLRGAPRTMATADRSHVSYVVTSHDPDDTYEQMRATLDNALARGELTEQVQFRAQQFNVQGLYNVTLTSPNTTQVAGPGTGDREGSSSKLSTAAIVGIVLGSLFWVVMLYALYRFVVHVRSDDRVYLKY